MKKKKGEGSLVRSNAIAWSTATRTGGLVNAILHDIHVAAVVDEIIGDTETNRIVDDTGGDAVIKGLAGNDTLQGGSGNDVLDGGSGIDTASFSSVRNTYQISKDSQTFAVKANTATDGIDTLISIERLQFSDKKLAFDLNPSNGNAAITAKILGAVFGAASISNSEYVGIGLRLLDSGTSYADLMQFALNAKLGIGFSNADEVNLLYQNLVGTHAPTSELNYYVGTINSGVYTPISLAIMAADLELNLNNINLLGLAQTGLEYF